MSYNSVGNVGYQHIAGLQFSECVSGCGTREVDEHVSLADTWQTGVLNPHLLLVCALAWRVHLTFRSLQKVCDESPFHLCVYLEM